MGYDAITCCVCVCVSLLVCVFVPRSCHSMISSGWHERRPVARISMGSNGEGKKTKKNTLYTYVCTHTLLPDTFDMPNYTSLLFSPPPLVEEESWGNLEEHLDREGLACRMVRAAGTRGYTQTHTSHKCTHSTSQTVRQLSSHQLLSQPVSHPNKQSTHLSLYSTKQLSNKPSIQPVTCRRDEGQPYWYTSLRHRRHTGL